MFGRSYNRQFKVILGFTLLNFLVAAGLAVIRKRMGVFGKIPVRTMENEFTGKKDETVDDTEDKTEVEKKSEGEVVEGREGEGAVRVSKGSN